MLRGCSNRDVRKLMSAVFRSGMRYRQTRNGIMVYGQAGTDPVSIHMTVSDKRGHLNLRRDLLRIGLNIGEK